MQNIGKRRYRSGVSLAVAMLLAGCASVQHPLMVAKIASEVLPPTHPVAALPEQNTMDVPAQTVGAGAAEASPQSSSSGNVAQTAAATKNPPPDKNSSPDDQGQPKKPIKIRLLKYIGLKDENRLIGGRTPVMLAELYTRIIIENNDDGLGTGDGTDVSCPLAAGATAGDPCERSYDAEKRSWLARLFKSEHLNIAALMTLQVNEPAIPMGTVVLFSATHDSARIAGETFQTNLTGSDIGTPLFRLTANTNVMMHLKSDIIDTQTFTISTALLNGIRAAVNIAAPAAPVFTTLSKPDVDNAAKAIDTTLNGLFSSERHEDIQLVSLPSAWSLQKDKPAAIVTVEGWVPRGMIKMSADASADAAGKNRSNSDDYSHKTPGPREADKFLVGSWKVEALCPRPSIFNPRDICSGIGGNLGDKNSDNAAGSGNNNGVTKNSDKNSEITDPEAIVNLIHDAKKAVLTNISPSQILNTNLRSGVTVSDYVVGYQAYADFISTKPVTAASLHTFCAKMVGGLTGVGLNEFDAYLVLWAMSKNINGISTLSQTEMDSTGHTPLTVGKQCKTGTETDIDLDGADTPLDSKSGK